MTTYDEARAACVERWGAPSWQNPQPPCAHWDQHDPDGVIILAFADGVLYVRVEVGRETEHWVVTCATPMRGPLTPLPDALDAAERWLAAHNNPTKGP